MATNPGPRSSIECLYLNSRSFKAFVETDDKPYKVYKIDVFQQLVYSGDYDVVCVCETWLNDLVLDNELLAGYSIFRRDRLGRTGGGLLIAVKDTIRTKRRYDLERNNAEFVVGEFSKRICNQSYFTLSRPPNSSLDSIQQLNSSLDDNPESACVLLTGDFNLPAIDWSLDHPSPTSAGGHLEDKFCELVGDYYLEQLISGPTHRDCNKLDLLLCNYPEIIRNVITTSPEQYGYPTDHHILEFAIQQNFSRSQPIKRTIFDYDFYERGNFEQLRNALINTTFEDMPSENIDHHWNFWKEWFLAHVKNYIPMKVVTDTNSPPWIDGEVCCVKKISTVTNKCSKTKTVNSISICQIPSQTKTS